MNSVGSKVDDLEEGEIEEDTLEDISDCSISEVLVTQKDLEHDSDIELLRAEALKSLPGDDEVPEEELYRLEALRSLLSNIESSEKISPADEIRRKKRKHKRRSRRKKEHEVESSEVLKTVNDCEESKLLVEATEELTSTSQIDNSPNMDFSDKENQTDSDMNLVARSWYPKTDFALLNLCTTEMSNETKPRKSFGIDDFIIVPRILSVANNDTKSTINETVPKGKPVNRCVRFNRVEMPVNRASVLINKNYPVLPPATHLSRYKKISKHLIQKYPVSPPTNRYSLRNVRKGKYKIVNKSCYSLKKTVNSSPTKTVKQNTLSKSVYSLNRVQKQPSSSKQSQFIIELGEDDSGKEDYGSFSTEKPKVKSTSKLRNSDELPCSELPNSVIFPEMAENGLVDESVPEPSSMVENESSKESCEMALAETESKVSVDFENDEAMPLVQVTTASMTCHETLFSENKEHISPGMYSDEINDETEVSEIPHAADESLAIHPRIYSEEKSEEPNIEMSKMIQDDDVASPNLYSRETILPNQNEVSEMPVDIAECDVSFTPHTRFVFESEQLTEEPKLLDVAVCTTDDYDARLVIKQEPLDSDPMEDLSMEDNAECDITNGDEIDNCENSMVLQDVENELIEIRAKLLINLGELEEGMKKDESDREKLNTMLKKLLVLKSSILRFENKIRAHQSKLAIHADAMQALVEKFVAETHTYAHMKNVCFRVGMEIEGPQYKPPAVYEEAIEEKIKVIDFSKYVPNVQ